MFHGELRLLGTPFSAFFKMTPLIKLAKMKNKTELVCPDSVQDQNYIPTNNPHVLQNMSNASTYLPKTHLHKTCTFMHLKTY